MNIIQMVAELRAEQGAIEEAIIVLERLARGHGKRRGRPPKWMSEHPDAPPAKTKAPRKRTVSPEARARMATAQRKRWAKRRAEENVG